ncbi:uncharacterized protein MONBRDRAFT_33648 [Monosiga brevicollis MX1]|uniref:Homologous-pairing protein 2 homolog n=1 Tax=Monosiga brevicollis TaxID=81824 RepID=A9V6T0_MONBE|nr:uncharacterized protein MONBRDRAFT_33648 [Monosiga brevicollis MX1]EDQ86788.1 predicted protein [Monosiga brevicollis MX1]|eukprot:XP_001748333.1 hypothetical protein [Monosiga brevicollis MX1]
MPQPAAKKPKQIKDEKAASKMLEEYLLRQNRPYNANDLFANLHEAISKTVVGRALAASAEAGRLREKTYGKQKIYFVPQTDMDKLSKDELDALDEELDQLRKTHMELTSTVSALESELSKTLAEPTTDEADKTLAELQAEIMRKQAKLKGLRDDGETMTEADRKRINDKYTKFLVEWKKRRRLARDILDQILEGYPKPKKQLYVRTSVLLLLRNFGSLGGNDKRPALI